MQKSNGAVSLVGLISLKFLHFDRLIFVPGILPRWKLNTTQEDAHDGVSVGCLTYKELRNQILGEQTD